jgi:hypothetical protein
MSGITTKEPIAVAPMSSQNRHFCDIEVGSPEQAIGFALLSVGALLPLFDTLQAH